MISEEDTAGDTWPCPPPDAATDELTDRELLLLAHLKLDVMARELSQHGIMIELIQHEVQRHGCKIGLTEVEDHLSKRGCGRG